VAAQEVTEQAQGLLVAVQLLSLHSLLRHQLTTQLQSALAAAVLREVTGLLGATVYQARLPVLLVMAAAAELAPAIPLAQVAQVEELEAGHLVAEQAGRAMLVLQQLMATPLAVVGVAVKQDNPTMALQVALEAAVLVLQLQVAA
jgi:hypothetical protein